MVPADKTKMSSTRALLWVYFMWFCFIVVSLFIYLSRVFEFDVIDFFFLQTRFAEVYWYNNKIIIKKPYWSCKKVFYVAFKKD